MISIIVLNWNTSEMTIRLYNSIKKNTCQDFNFYVLDNGSKNEEYQKLFTLFNENEFVRRNEKNVGFAAGNNQICKIIKNYNHGHVFFINSDIIIKEKYWDLKMVEMLDQNQFNVGIVGCAYHPLKWDDRGNFHIQPLVNYPVESESVQGAFFGIHKNLFDELMREDFIFDEEFKYAHYEETDLCFRIRKMGYKIYWLPVEHVHDHHNSATKRNGYNLNDEIKNQADFKANSERNKQLLVKKHFS